MYLVNEIFYSIQGEGYWSGRPAVFLRFSRCNLTCDWCDTDFAFARKYVLPELVMAIEHAWPQGHNGKMVVLTGGEPALQADKPLVLHLRHLGFYVAIETNGTRPLSPGIDWICVSPKAGTQLHPHCTTGDELKVVYPQSGLDLDQLVGLKFSHRWLSPMDGLDLAENTAKCLDYVLADPRWRLNIQTHKVIGAR